MSTRGVPPNFGSRLRATRLRRDCTQEELAQVVGVRRASVANYETEQALPSLVVLMRLADRLHTTTDYLLGRRPEGGEQTP